MVSATVPRLKTSAERVKMVSPVKTRVPFLFAFFRPGRLFKPKAMLDPGLACGAIIWSYRVLLQWWKMLCPSRRRRCMHILLLHLRCSLGCSWTPRSFLSPNLKQGSPKSYNVLNCHQVLSPKGLPPGRILNLAGKHSISQKAVCARSTPAPFEDTIVSGNLDVL